MNQATRYRRAVQFRVLGPLEVDAGDGPVPLGGPKQRAVLANLLIRANQVVPADHLIDEIWGEEPPEKARNTLQTYVSNLRKSLGDDRLQGRPPGYVLLLDPWELDATRFDSLVRDAKKALAVDPAVALSTLEDALALWRGPALADLADRPSLLAEAARLDELRLEAQEDRVEGLLAGGDDARAVGEVETLISQQPLRESLWGLLMLALYRDGRQADALNAYQRAREILADQLGIDPSAELARLHERVLQQDPALDLKGEPLRGYRLLEKLGDGPDGVVFRAIQPHVGRDVAVKVFREGVASDPAFVRRFEPDAQAAAALEHPHIVPTYDAWREPGRAYMVSRYLRGGSLRALHARGDRPAPGVATRIVEQVASALASSHRQGVVHGHVCASNVLFDADGNAYLGDFIVRSSAAGTREDDVRALAGLARELLGSRIPEHLAELGARAEADADVPDADAFVEAARMTLEPSLVAAEVWADARNPYKGLRPFAETDASDFFGRTALIDRLLARFDQSGAGSRFLAVVGPSGGGKSSVVRAGLVPAIRRGALEGSSDRFVAEMFPGVHPIEELEAVLMRIAVRPASRLRDTLEAGSRGVLEAVDQVVPGDADVVLVVDQFEEVFTLTANERERELFLDSLRVACVDPESRVRVIVTLRADFYDRPLVYPRFGELLAARTEAMPPLTPDELEQAIRRPAERTGIHPEPGLEAAMVADVAHQPGALPLLQFALTELFERRTGDELTLDAYREIGGVAGALSARAERLYREADRSWQRSVRQVFLRLVTLGEGSQDTRRRVTRSELDALEVDPATVDDVLETFGRHRLLTFDREPSTREPTVEIAHEALLSAWSRLGGWIDEAREDLRLDQRLVRAAAEWSGSGQDPSFLLRGARLEQVEAWSESTDLAHGRQQREYIKASIDRRALDRASEEERRSHEARVEHRSRTRLRALVAVFAVAALVAASLTIVATEQRERAGRSARVAEARALAAQANSSLDVDPERSMLLAALAIDRTRAADGTVLPEAEEAMHRAIVTSRVSMTARGVGGEVAWGADDTFAAQVVGRPGTIAIGSTVTGEVQRRIAVHESAVTGLEFSSDGSLLVSTGEDGRFSVLDVRTGEVAMTLEGAGGPALSPTFDEDGSIVAVAWPQERVIRVVALPSGRIVGSIPAIHPSELALSPDGRALAWSRVKGPVSVVEVDRRSVLVRLHPFSGIGALAWSPDGRYIATGSIPGTDIWDATTGDLVVQLPGQPWVDALAWSPDGVHLASAGEEATGTMIWSVRDGIVDAELTFTSIETNDGVKDVAFSPSGSHVMVGALDGSTVKAWDLGVGGDAEVANLSTVGSFGDVAFMPDGALVAVDESGRLRLHDLESGEATPATRPEVRLLEHQFALSPDGHAIAFPGDVEIRSTTAPWRSFDTGYDADMDGLAWNADGSLIAIADQGRGLTVIVDQTGRLVTSLPDRGPSVTWQARFSPDGRLLATIGAADRRGSSSVVLWDWRRNEVIWSTRTDDAEQLTYDPAGSRIVTYWGAPTILDAATGARMGSLEGGPAELNDIEFSPDGRLIAGAGRDGIIYIYDARSGTMLYTLRTDDPWPVGRLAFSHDGSTLAAQSPEAHGGPGQVHVWTLDVEELLEIARGKLTREITDEECRRFLHLERCPPRSGS